MSGIAEIMKNLGYSITGSDQASNSNVKRLKKNGIKIFLGHKPSNISNASLIVHSSAIPENNCEIVSGRKQKIPIIGRSEMLRELMRMKKISVIIRKFYTELPFHIMNNFVFVMFLYFFQYFLIWCSNFFQWLKLLVEHWNIFQVFLKDPPFQPN